MKISLIFILCFLTRFLLAQNNPPTDISLNATSVVEHVIGGTQIGTLTSTDLDLLDTFTYKLVSGIGSKDSASFTITGNSLTINSSPIFEIQSTYNIRVRTTDQGGLFFEKAFTITVIDLPPTDIALSASTVIEHVAANSAVGTLSSTDPDMAGNTFTYQLVPGSGSADNGSFSITGNSLTINTSPVYEVKNSYNLRISTTNSGGLSFEKAFTITVIDLPPTDISLSASTVIEHVVANSAVGTLSSTDPDMAGNTFTYQLAPGSGSADNGSFTITGNSLTINISPVYEVKNSYSIRISTTNSGGLSFEKAFTITVIDLPPTDIALSASSVIEHVAANTAIGTLSSTDPDMAGNTFTYKLVSGSGSADNGSFTISGNSLNIKTSPVYEVKNSYSVRISTTNSGGLSFEKAFTITVIDLPPTDIALSASSVIEHVAANFVVGTLSTLGPDPTYPFTYSLVSGTGNADNALFTITGSSLSIINSPIYEVKNSYNIRISTTNMGGLSFEKAFTITVINLPPTDVALSANTVIEHVAANSAVGTLSSTDPDMAGNTFTYQLVSGSGSADNGSFIISGNSLTIKTSPVYEVKNSYSVRISTTNSGGLSFEKAFTITVIDLPPTDIALSATSINEGVQANSVVGTLSSSDPDVGNTFTYTLVSGTGSADNSAFTIAGNSLLLNNPPSFTTKNNYTIRIRTMNQAGTSFEKPFTITVNDLPPTNINLSNNSVKENLPTGTLVGNLSAVGPDPFDSYTFTFVTGTGSTDNSSFIIVGGQLQTNAILDYETQTIFSIRIRTTDLGGLWFEKVFAINLIEVNETPVANNVKITGLTAVCKTLTGTYDYFDEDNDSQGVSTFRWLWSVSAGGATTPIAGATSLNYTLTLNDQNKYIYFEVTPKALTGVSNGTPVTSAATAQINNLLPTVSISSAPGTFCQGKSANLSFTFTGTPPFALTYANGSQKYSITAASNSYSTTITQGGSYKGVTLIDNLNCEVTDLPSVANVTVNQLPTVKITGLNTAYNVNNNPVVMQGSPLGGTFSGAGVVPSTNTFYPSIAGVPNSPHPIVYNYTSPATGCTNTDTVKVTIIDADAVIVGFRVQNKYCKFDKPFIISGANSAGAMGSFSISGGTGLVNHNNNTATISPSALGAGTYTVTYTYLNVVQLSISKSFSVEVAFPAQILNLPAAVYCSNIADIKLLGTYNSATIYGVFSGNGIVKKADSLYYFKPSVATVGSRYIYYTNAENYGCKTTDSVKVTIAASPKSLFEVANKCWKGDSTIFVNLSTPAISITNNYWNFGDNQATETDNKSILKNPKHKYLSAGSKIVQLISVANGCRDTVKNTINLGGIPNLDFSWNTECFNTGIPINFKSIITGTDVIGSYNWTIKGSGPNVINYTTANFSHSFAFPGDYKVNLLANTTANCKDSIQKQIRVRPSYSLKDTSYNMDFENGRQYWYENENTTNKWMFGKPAGANIKSTYSGINSFYTAIPNNLNQQLIVSSPCFDFSQTTKPFIELWINGDNPKDKEGAVLQYQFEDSVNWSTLGAIGSGLNWYNSSSIESGPGNQKLGWSGSTSGWVSARHSLDKLNGYKNVRFRIVYATNSSITGRDGFAFDNILIGQRNKSILFEHFANNSSSLSNQSNDKVSELLNSSPADLISLQYHTSFPGSDSLNSNNQSDPGARVLYYGVGSIPVGIVNGGTDSKYIYDFSNNIPNINDINLLSVKDAEYQFNIFSEIKNSVISGTIKVQASKDIPLRQTTVYIAIAEDITVQSSGKQVIYYNVVKKILPSAAGTPLRIALVKGQTVPVPFSWTVSKIYNSDRIKVVVFIQDENTREIYQVASSNNKLFTSVDDLSEASTSLSDMEIYPNPASNLAIISFEKELMTESVLNVIDSYGRIVKNIQVLPHSSLIEISVNDLPNGLYFVRLVHKNGHSRTLKLLIAH